MLPRSAALLAPFLLVAIASARGQGPVPATAAALWYVDPASGNPRALPATASSPSTLFTGTLTLTVDIDLISSMPENAVLRCSALAGLLVDEQVTINGTALDNFMLAEPGSNASVDAKVLGKSATCIFTIPYSWTAPRSTSDPASGQKTTFIVTGIQASVGVASDVLGTDRSVVRTLRGTSVVAASASAPVQDDATTTLTAGTVL